MTDLSFYQNRLSKNRKRLKKWAVRGDIRAFRLYDRDIPEFPVIVDWFDTESGPRVHLQEVDTGWIQTAAEHAEWGGFVREATAETLEIDPQSIAIKLRVRQRVKSEHAAQYQPTGRRGEDLVVHEGGHRFWVNLDAYLDTGLFLDHRTTRALVGEAAPGKRFLNLFAYTGSFTVYAAACGAVSSDTVDLSNTYTDWAERNLLLNQLSSPTHRVHRADVFTWLREAVEANRQYDLIVLDPPTFSNSKKMLGILDVQRDHIWLIRQCLEILSRDGQIYFSTNMRTFELDAQIQTRARFVEISSATVPEDFRDRRVHRCWRICR